MQTTFAARATWLPLLALVGAHVSAASAALNPTAVRAAAAYSASHRGASLLVMQNGRTLHESYPGGGAANEARKIYSGTKAFWNLAALAAAQDGILSLDERVANTILSWRTDRRKSRVTIRQ
nr:serine hydrolase [Chthoniobacterales bacterium]